MTNLKFSRFFTKKMRLLLFVGFIASMATGQLVALASGSASIPPSNHGVPCVELVNGVMTMGTCVGTFKPLNAPSSSPAPAPSPSATPAPPLPSPTPASSGWKTVVNDQFISAGIPSHWSLYDGPYHSGPARNCATPSQDSAPGDGYLYLKMSYKSSGVCGAGWYEGGMMIASAYNYPNQAVTVRWRIIPSAHPSVVYSHHIIPMLFPDSDPVYRWYNAEADLCETESYSHCWTFLHDGTASTASQVANKYIVDLTTWHTWRFEQKNGVLVVYIDNMTTPVWTYRSSNNQLPSALRRLVLQQECPVAACPPASYAGNVETIQIDYVTLQIPS